MRSNSINLISRVVSTLEAAEYANSNDMIYIEVSAKIGYNVEEIFINAAKLVYEKYCKDGKDILNEEVFYI